MAQAKLFGSSIKRREDPRMITGRGLYTDDVKLAGQTHAVFVRSPHAHARVKRVDVSAAKRVPGVVAAFTGKDLAAHCEPWVAVLAHLKGMKSAPQRPLPIDRAT